MFGEREFGKLAVAISVLGGFVIGRSWYKIKTGTRTLIFTGGGAVAGGLIGGPVGAVVGGFSGYSVSRLRRGG